MRVRPSLLGLHHVALNVTDVAAMTRFYVEMLGFRVEWQPDADNVYLTSGSDNLALHRQGDLRAASGVPAAAQTTAREGRVPARLDHLGLIVPSPADVDAWAAYLEEQDVHLEGPPRTHRDGARSIYLRDPEDNRLQIIYHPPISDRS